MKHINRTKNAIHSSIVDFWGTGHEVEIAMQWNARLFEVICTFANTINTHRRHHEEGCTRPVPSHQ